MREESGVAGKVAYHHIGRRKPVGGYLLLIHQCSLPNVRGRDPWVEVDEEIAADVSLLSVGKPGHMVVFQLLFFLWGALIGERVGERGDESS
jgi:hypothetical protein